MSFLAPLFLAGAAAVALPFLFHLIRRSSRDKVLFSSLMFLRPSPPRLTKRSRLEHLLLLALRCVVLCLLALAFARPFVAKPVSGTPPPADRNYVLVLLDSSASMRREDLWQQGKRAALKALDELQPGDQAGLYLFDLATRPVLGLSEAAAMTPADRTAAAASRLDSFEPSFAGTRLGSALVAAAELLMEALNRDARDQGATRSRIILISDLQSGAKLDGLQGFEWPKKLSVEVVALSARDHSNVTLQLLQEQQRFLFASSNSPVRVRIHNSLRSVKEQLKLQWTRNGTPLPAGVDVYVPAGQSNIITAPPAPSGADALEVQGDAIPFDNRAYYEAPRRMDVLVGYAGSESSQDPTAALYYIRRTFEQASLSVRVDVLTNPPPAADPELLIFGQSPAPPALDVAKRLLSRGKTVLVPLIDESSINTLRSLLDAPALTVTEADVRSHAILGEISFTHPLFAPFADPRYSDFTKIHFWRYRRMDFAAITNAAVIARFDSRDPALVEIPSGSGRIIVLASSWSPKDSQLALSSKFVPLLFALLEQSASRTASLRSYLVGDTVVLPSTNSNQQEIILPGGAKLPVENSRFTATLPGIHQAGDFRLAVNIDPAEGRLAPITTQELQTLGVPIGSAAGLPTLASITREQHLLAVDLESRQKLWRNFILAAIAFVLLETWISGRLSRRLAAA